MTIRSVSAVLLAGASITLPQAARADDGATQGNREIVVSVKQPGQSAWSYPGSIAVIAAQDLEDRRVSTLATLSYGAPNVSLDEIGTFKGVANFAIRGLGVNSSIPSIDPVVGLYVDGVYMGVNAGTVFDTLDLARVEVLRGPQGVVFGRNTTGGAVLVSTAEPARDGWEGHARVGAEGPVDGGRGAPLGTGRLVVSGPLSETLAVRLGALHTADGGYFRNRLNGDHLGGYDNTVLRGALGWYPTDAFTLTLKGEWNRSDGDGAATHNNGQNARDRFDLAINEKGFHHSRSKFAVLRAEYRTENGLLTNVAGWRKYGLRTRNDIDSSPLTIFHSDTRTAQEQWSNDLYYTHQLEGLELTAGAYLFHQSMGYEEVRFLAASQYGGGRLRHDQAELFGQAVVTIAQGLDLSAGLRWSHEAKRARVTYVRPRAACSAVARTCPVSGTNPANPLENNGFADKASWNALSPRLVLGWQASEQLRAWAGWSRGRRSGGYNLRITQPAAFEQVAAALGTPAYGQERVDSFELGVKWRDAGGKASLSAALFQTDVAGMQREINVPSLTSGLAQSIFNTADARIRGGEVEASAEPLAGLRLSASLGYTHAEYRKVFFDINSDGAINAADLALALPRAPKWTWGIGAAHELPLGEKASLRSRVDFQHRSRFAYTDNNWGYNAAADRLDASVALALGEPAITISLFGRNLLDEVQFGGDTQLPFAGGAFSDGNNRPFDPHPAAGTFSPLAKGRTLGVEVALDF